MRGAPTPYQGLLRFEAATSNEARPWGVSATLAWASISILFVSLLAIANQGWDLNLSLESRILWAIVAYTMVVAMIVLATQCTPVPIRDYLGFRPQLRDVPLGLGCAVLAFFVTPVVAALIVQAIGVAPSTPAAQPPLSALMLVLGLIETIAVAPIAEEILFRGFMYRGLQARLGNVVALLMTSVLFGVTHKVFGYGWDHVVWASCIGLFLGSLRWWTGGITASIVTHAILNSPILSILLGRLLG